MGCRRAEDGDHHSLTYEHSKSSLYYRDNSPEQEYGANALNWSGNPTGLLFVLLLYSLLSLPALGTRGS
jgi:hypothetical protein